MQEQSKFSTFFVTRKNTHNYYKLGSELGLLKPLSATGQKCKKLKQRLQRGSSIYPSLKNRYGRHMDIYYDNAKFM